MFFNNTVEGITVTQIGGSLETWNSIQEDMHKEKESFVQDQLKSHVVSLQLRRITASQRLLVLAAVFHERLGKDALIASTINTDIGEIIAQHVRQRMGTFCIEGIQSLPKLNGQLVTIACRKEGAGGVSRYSLTDKSGKTVPTAKRPRAWLQQKNLEPLLSLDGNYFSETGHQECSTLITTYKDLYSDPADDTRVTKVNELILEGTGGKSDVNVTHIYVTDDKKSLECIFSHIESQLKKMENKRGVIIPVVDGYNESGPIAMESVVLPVIDQFFKHLSLLFPSKILTCQPLYDLKEIQPESSEDIMFLVISGVIRDLYSCLCDSDSDEVSIMRGRLSLADMISDFKNDNPRINIESVQTELEIIYHLFQNCDAEMFFDSAISALPEYEKFTITSTLLDMMEFIVHSADNKLCFIEYSLINLNKHFTEQQIQF